MGEAIEFVGRIARSDGKIVAAGRFNLCVRLHAGPADEAVLWSEEHDGVAVATGGAFQVVLGLSSPLSPTLFNGTPRWASVWIRGDHAMAESGDRVPITGGQVRLAEDIAAIRDVLDEASRGLAHSLPAGRTIDAESRRRLIKLHRRLRRVENGEGLLSGIRTRLLAMETRMHRLDDDESGRVIRLEDEIEDIVGPNGDILDLLERVEALEQGRVAAGVEPNAPVVDLRAEARLASLESRLQAVVTENDALRRSVEILAKTLAKGPAAGESFPGPVTVQKGGIHVASGGVLVRDIEGRVAGASRREGPLLVNSRSGGDVLVGNKVSGSVIAAGSLAGGRASGVGRTVAVRFNSAGEFLPGQVVSLDVRKKSPTIVLHASPHPPLGVVVESAAVELGDGTVLVAIVGVVRVKSVGKVAVGDALVAADGVACVRTERDQGPGLGRALAVPSGDTGEVEVLLFAP